MYNKTKTSMILSTTMIAIVAMLMTASNAYAVDHWYGGSALPNGDAEFYFHCSSLATLDVDGDRTNNCSKVQNDVQDAMTNYNGLGNTIDLTTTFSYGSGDYIVYGADLGIFGDTAQATYPNQSGDYLRFNDWRSFGTSGGCTLWYGYHIEWISNHEFGHTTGLNHLPDGTTSVMVDNCASTWSDVQTIDDNVLDDHYY